MAYIIMIIALGVTALFYDYLEVRLGTKITRKRQSLLTMIHLVLMNVGITGSTWLLMYVGYVGGSAILPTSSGGGGLTDAQAHVQILAPFPPVIIGFIFATLVGVTSGGLGYHRGRISGPICIEISISFLFLCKNFNPKI